MPKNLHPLKSSSPKFLATRSNQLFFFEIPCQILIRSPPDSRVNFYSLLTVPILDIIFLSSVKQENCPKNCRKPYNFFMFLVYPSILVSREAFERMCVLHKVHEELEERFNLSREERWSATSRREKIEFRLLLELAFGDSDQEVGGVDALTLEDVGVQEPGNDDGQNDDDQNDDDSDAAPVLDEMSEPEHPPFLCVSDGDHRVEALHERDEHQTSPISIKFRGDQISGSWSQASSRTLLGCDEIPSWRSLETNYGSISGGASKVCDESPMEAYNRSLEELFIALNASFDRMQTRICEWDQRNRDFYSDLTLLMQAELTSSESNSNEKVEEPDASEESQMDSSRSIAPDSGDNVETPTSDGSPIDSRFSNVFGDDDDMWCDSPKRREPNDVVEKPSVVENPTPVASQMDSRLSDFDPMSASVFLEASELCNEPWDPGGETARQVFIETSEQETVPAIFQEPDTTSEIKNDDAQEPFGAHVGSQTPKRDLARYFKRAPGAVPILATKGNAMAQHQFLDEVGRLSLRDHYEDFEVNHAKFQPFHMFEESPVRKMWKLPLVRLSEEHEGSPMMVEKKGNPSFTSQNLDEMDVDRLDLLKLNGANENAAIEWGNGVYCVDFLKLEGINITANRKGLKPWTEVITMFRGCENLGDSVIYSAVPTSWIARITGFKGGTSSYRLADVSLCEGYDFCVVTGILQHDNETMKEFLNGIASTTHKKDQVSPRSLETSTSCLLVEKLVPVQVDLFLQNPAIEKCNILPDIIRGLGRCMTTRRDNPEGSLWRLATEGFNQILVDDVSRFTLNAETSFTRSIRMRVWQEIADVFEISLVGHFGRASPSSALIRVNCIDVLRELTSKRITKTVNHESVTCFKGDGGSHNSVLAGGFVVLLSWVVRMTSFKGC